MICIGCGCSDMRACPGGCSWASHNPPVCSSCISLFDEADFSGPALENVVGYDDGAPLVDPAPYAEAFRSAPFDDPRISCAHARKLYVDGATFKCCSCGEFFCDEAA